MPVADTQRLLDLADQASARGLTVALGGQAVSAAEARSDRARRPSASVAAAVILLITFGTVVAAGLPIVVAVAGLGVSRTLIPLVSPAMRRAGLVDVAGHDDGHRHRHRLRRC